MFLCRRLRYIFKSDSSFENTNIYCPPGENTVSFIFVTRIAGIILAIYLTENTYIVASGTHIDTTLKQFQIENKEDRVVDVYITDNGTIFVLTMTKVKYYIYKYTSITTRTRMWSTELLNITNLQFMGPFENGTCYVYSKDDGIVLKIVDWNNTIRYNINSVNISRYSNRLWVIEKDTLICRDMNQSAYSGVSRHIQFNSPNNPSISRIATIDEVTVMCIHEDGAKGIVLVYKMFTV